jgi:HK97 family phage prohead protease
MDGAAILPADETELRFSTEIRSTGRVLSGLAAPFGKPTTIGGFTETIMPGAFKASLAANADVRCLVDHNDDKLLGRTRSGTLRLFEARAGLCFELDVPNTTLGNDILTLAQRGDLSGMSFGFSVPKGGDAWPTNNTRELRSVNLAEISVLHRLPAYDQTSVSARARQLGRRAAADARLRILFLESL